jgi:DedD protein
MATDKSVQISATELELKRRGRRRLIGAVTIGLLGIVFLPMIFDSEPKRDKTSNQEIAIQIPPRDGQPALPAPTNPVTNSVSPPAVGTATGSTKGSSLPVESLPLPSTAAKLGSEKSALPATLPPSPPPKAATVTSTQLPTPPVKVEPKQTPEPAKLPAKEPATKEPVKVETPKAESPKSVPPPVAPAAVSPVPAKANDTKTAFVVQLGAFKDAENAQQIVTRMKEAKLPVFTDKIATQSGSVTRVRVGPFATREKADAALAQVKLAGVDGKVVPQ